MPWCSAATRCNDMQHVATRCRCRKRCFCNATQHHPRRVLHVANRSVLQKTFVTPKFRLPVSHAGCPMSLRPEDVRLMPGWAPHLSPTGRRGQREDRFGKLTPKKRSEACAYPTCRFLHVARYALVNPDLMAVCKPRFPWPRFRKSRKPTPPTIQRLPRVVAKPDTPPRWRDEPTP